MRYESLMLTKTQLESYQFFESLSKLPRRRYLIRDLAGPMNCPPAKVKYALERIAELIDVMDPSQGALFRQSKYLDLAEVTISLSDFRFLLMKEHSIAFQFLLWILMAEDASMESFLEAHYISQSTLNRGVRALQRYLRNYRVQISLTNFQIQAPDELMLRQSLFYLFWLGTKGETSVFGDYQIEESVITELLKNVPQEHHYVMSKLYRLKLIIQHYRVKKGHYMTENQRLQLLLDTPALDKGFIEMIPDIPVTDKRLEAEGLLSNVVVSPLFFSYDQPLIDKHLTLHQQATPELAQLPEAFLTYFETHILKMAIPYEERQVLLANLTQAAAGIWVFDGTFPNLHYFLLQEQDNPANLQYELEVRQFFQSDEIRPFLNYRTYFRTFEKSFAHILQPYYVKNMTWPHLLVGVAVEPNSILHDKIKLVLDSIYFVDTQPFIPAEAEKYDLVISSIGQFLTDYPEVPCHIWNIAEEDEDLPFLFYRLRDVFYQKTSKLRFI